VAKPGGEPADEPLQVPGDLPGYLVRPRAPHRQVEVAPYPGGEAVVDVAEAPAGLHYLS
jgi:hypothetical protein